MEYKSSIWETLCNGTYTCFDFTQKTDVLVVLSVDMLKCFHAGSLFGRPCTSRGTQHRVARYSVCIRLRALIADVCQSLILHVWASLFQSSFAQHTRTSCVSRYVCCVCPCVVCAMLMTMYVEQGTCVELRMICHYVFVAALIAITVTMARSCPEGVCCEISLLYLAQRH